MAEQWIKRLGTKRSGFRYVRDGGTAVRDRRTLSRIASLRVPPAWRGVHIAPSSARAIQAWGFDARGRKQYRYNARAVAARELRKHHRVRHLGKALPRIRRTLMAQSRQPRLTRATTCAIALRLISEGLFRPGNERYERENRSHGMTTLRKRHVRLDGKRAVFLFPGKSRKRQRRILVDADLRRLVARIQRTPGSRLFRYREGRAWRDLSAPMLIAYVRERLGPYAVKDFRTWGGTLRVATVLAELGSPASKADARRNIALAMRFVAAELGNTPAICRSSYVHPMVTARYIDAGETIPIRARGHRSRIRHTPEERALLTFLDRHFRERRHRPIARMSR